MAEHPPGSAFQPEDDPSIHQQGQSSQEWTDDQRQVLEAAQRIVDDAAEQMVPRDGPLPPQQFTDHEAVLASAGAALEDAGHEITIEQREMIYRKGEELREQMVGRATEQARQDYFRRKIADRRQHPL